MKEKHGRKWLEMQFKNKLFLEYCTTVVRHFQCTPCGICPLNVIVHSLCTALRDRLDLLRYLCHLELISLLSNVICDGYDGHHATDQLLKVVLVSLKKLYKEQSYNQSRWSIQDEIHVQQKVG